ncbi:nitroreductase [Microbacterium sp. MEC084]|uniref:nitroreductase family protein n=1 Tax=unclassified Microbacterium TaxID=2609290 RepID=UPI0006F88B9F|nr:MULTISPECIES: nitroreductase family protein [unclassified Microbacterium]KQZ05814.1 nitroreductase [Microbacterium sp. Root53]MCD1269071.1 nitroreductase [Microbacterium sp. MEC084]
MGAATLDRTANTDHPVLDVLAERWSPRAYDPVTPIDERKLSSALEAARWTPSAMNLQPWKFIVARRGTAEHAAIAETLMGFNQAWAPAAAVLIVTVAIVRDAEGNEIPTAIYDLGQAAAHLSVQAHHDGLVVHQMTGFDPAAVAATFELPENERPFSVIALGEFGDLDALPEPLRERELAPRTRRPIAESLIVNA